MTIDWCETHQTQATPGDAQPPRCYLVASGMSLKNPCCQITEVIILHDAVIESDKGSRTLTLTMYDDGKRYDQIFPLLPAPSRLFSNVAPSQ